MGQFMPEVCGTCRTRGMEEECENYVCAMRPSSWRGQDGKKTKPEGLKSKEKLMTKTAKKTKKVDAPEITAGEGYKEISRGDYALANIEVKDNFRKTFNEKAMRELAESITKFGVVQSVILRESGHKGRGEYILVAGERRYRAAKMAGLQVIPGRVLDIKTEEEAAEVQAIENLHRKDLSPIEEARAFKVLLDQKGHSVEQAEDLGNRVGKSKDYVYRALRLLELPDNAINNIEAGKWTPAHGHQLLRITREEELERVMKWLDEDGLGYYESYTVPTAMALKKEIEGRAQDLKEAIFPTDQEYGKDIACNGCAENSSNQGGLFDGAEKGQCLNPACFERKSSLARKEKVAQALEKMPEGVRNLGTKSTNSYGNINGLKGARKITEITKDVRKAVEANPKAFAMAMIEERFGNNHSKEPVLICTDPSALGEKATKADNRINEARQSYLEDAVELALMKAMYAKIHKNQIINPELYRFIADAIFREGYGVDDMVAKTLGLEDSDALEKYLKNNPHECAPVALLAAVACNKDLETDLAKPLKTLNVDVKGITKATKASAGKEYDSRNHEQKGKGTANTDGDE